MPRTSGHPAFTRAALTLLMVGLCGPGAFINPNISFTNFFANNGANVAFSRPVFFAEIPGRDSNYVVLEQQTGNAIVVHRRNGLWVKDTLLHIGVVANRNEMGFLGLAFHPNFTVNRKYYVFYSQSFTAPYASNTDDCATTNPGCGVNVIEERVADTSLIKDAGVAPRQILKILKSAMNHDGGDIHFGPSDGYLYVGIGDGGDPQGDAPDRGQNPDTLLGKFLRIDVDHPAGGKAYGIPADNPFVSTPGYRPEIWARGLRNPWRWSFDRLTGTVWIGEVGNATREEVDTLAKGANLGWRLMEGHSCQPGVTCSLAGLTLPIFDYPHSGGDTTGVSVIGGYVYRGDPTSPYYGLYFFGDNSTGRAWVMRSANGFKTESITLHPTPMSTLAAVTGLSAFGQDRYGTLYALGWTSNTAGSVFVITSPFMNPVAVTPRRNPGAAPLLSTEDLLRHPGDFEIRGLDGKKISLPVSGDFSGTPSGTFWVRPKGGNQLPQLITLLR